MLREETIRRGDRERTETLEKINSLEQMIDILDSNKQQLQVSESESRQLQSTLLSLVAHSNSALK